MLTSGRCCQLASRPAKRPYPQGAQVTGKPGKATPQRLGTTLMKRCGTHEDRAPPFNRERSLL
eukprot:11454734-Prorocentrum_lima.AAC.1